MNDTSGGRRILLLVGASVVVISGILGVFIGENGGQVAAEISLFGVLSLPTSPLAFSLYGMAFSAVILAVLFALVEYASRVENAQ
ncbi:MULTISPECIES: DUF7520 family protein [Haloferax]|uniref:Cox cluster protein n=4 Tax=Haloferax TaxID=2251 RepID=M0IQC0_9EURY|nr:MULTISPECIES: hypothetical protein [Haloferax]ELZ97669.1 hypothetical protein C441_02497 [Haloferax sulfurifontis ATCC BAA-897]EMA01273.1 hypothetical protein C438_16179 [Haloferax denitrificans ATCC 35960]GGC56451.1 hypothetical protein GCM10007209_17820 [Haloferax sulfurifontis]